MTVTGESTYILEKDEPIVEVCPACNPKASLEAKYEYNLVHECPTCQRLWIFNITLNAGDPSRIGRYFRNKGILVGQSTREYQKLL